MDKSYDILVIGAGPAGSTTARLSASMGAKVLLIDKKKNPGFPVQCGELVSQWIFRYLPKLSNSIVQRIENIIIHLPDGDCFKMKNPGVMIERSVFDKELLTYAILAGADFSMATKAIEHSPKGVIVEKNGKKELINSKIIIGADGVNSIVSRWIGTPQIKKIHTIQVEAVIFETSSDAEIYFDKKFEGGYAWFFPKGMRVNIGIGIISSKGSNLPYLMDDFLEFQKKSGKLKRLEIISKTTGFVPCEPSQKIISDNIILVGDAAGFAHPISGAGIMNAIISGEMAGTISAEAINRNDISYLENYEREWKGFFGKSISYGFRKRKFLEENWNNPEINFRGLIKSCWVGFKEYYDDLRGRKDEV